MATRKTIVKDVSRLESEPTLSEVAAFFVNKLANIPPEYANKAQCYIREWREFDDASYIQVEISYCYPETKEEAKVRRAAEKAEKQRKIDAELEQLQYLQDKHAKIYSALILMMVKKSLV